MATGPTRENAAPNDGLSSRSVRITTSYHEYTPPFAVEPIVRRMLDSVPDKYLSGLNEVALTNTSGMSRERRRAVTKSRKRKVRMLDARGLYHPAWNNRPAWIEIFVDNILRGWEKGLWLYIPFMREGGLAEVLFHEIGHHIHYTTRPEHKEREDVADVWKARLQRNYSRARHPWLRAITSPFRFLIRAISSGVYRKALRKEMISRAEFEELMNPNTKTL
jgi:hypothetical protein